MVANRLRALDGKEKYGCSRKQCTAFIQLAIDQLSQAQFTVVRDGILEEYVTNDTREAFKALDAYTDQLLYLPKEATQASEAAASPSNPPPNPAPTSSAVPTSGAVSISDWVTQKVAQGLPRDLGTGPTSLFTLLGTKRAASSEPPTQPKKLRLNVRQRETPQRETPQRETPHEEPLRLTLVQLEKLIGMSKVWQEQHRLLTIFLACSSPVRATPSASTPSLPSPTLIQDPLLPSPTIVQERQFLSDGTIPCTYPSEGLSSSPPPQDPSSQGQPAPNTSTWSDSTTTPPSPSQIETWRDPSSSISEPLRKTAGRFRVKVPRPGPPPLHHKTNRARELYHAFQKAKAWPSTVKAVRAGIRKQAREADVYPEFQALLLQPGLPSTPAQADRG